MNVKHQQVNNEKIHVFIKPFSKKDIHLLKKNWLTLEQHAENQFFLSWKWISCWLEQVINQEKINLVQAEQDGKVVGLGLFVEKKIVRHVVFKSKQWLLHRTGDSKKDQIWIENNNFLLAKDNIKNISDEIWKTLFTTQPQVDEFIVAIANTQHEKKICPINSHYCEINNYQENGYYINLEKINNLTDYLSLLSKNTRQQIKRSIKNLDLLGTVEFTVFTDNNEQWQQLEQSKKWHINKWQQTNTPSGFCNELFVDFHKRLITTSHASSKTLVTRLKIDQEVVGCLYCLLDADTAYFYLSTLKPIQNNKIKLGLTMHSLLVEWLVTNNKTITRYDFLAGDAQYKKSLAQYNNQYTYKTIQKKSLLFILETRLKALKTRGC